MAQAQVCPDLVLRCIENYRAHHIKSAQEWEANREAWLKTTLRTKWWQFWRYKTLEEAIQGDIENNWAYVFNGVSSVTSDVNRDTMEIKSLAENAKYNGRLVTLDEDDAYLLRFA